VTAVRSGNSIICGYELKKKRRQFASFLNNRPRVCWHWSTVCRQSRFSVVARVYVCAENVRLMLDILFVVWHLYKTAFRKICHVARRRLETNKIEYTHSAYCHTPSHAYLIYNTYTSDATACVLFIMHTAVVFIFQLPYRRSSLVLNSHKS